MSNVISITTECLDLYSIAFCHNRIQLLRSVTLRNVSDFNLKNLELEITSSPKFFSDHLMRIGEISSDRYSKLSQIELSVDKTMLSYLSASVSSTVNICVKSQGEVLAEHQEQVLLIPYDTVPALSHYPELIAAFVTPDQTEVRTIGDSVYKYIADESVPSNMDMWKGADRDTAYAIISALYESVRSLRITYNASSVSIDTKHTKCKLPEAIFTYKSANALEIAILFASVCEYIGFNPFLVFCNGKAYVGVYFTDTTTLSPVADDGKLFSELVDGVSYDCCVISPSSLANGTHISFEDSAKMAHREIEGNDFPIVVDVKECRRSNIRPIYTRNCKDGNIIFEQQGSLSNVAEYKIPSNSSQLAHKVKNSIFKNNSESPLVSPSMKNTAFLVGNGKSITAKFMFNPRVVLKSFSVPGIVSQDHEQMLETLLKLNANSDVTDVSDSVSTLYEKDVFNRKLFKLIDSEKSNRSLYLAFGLVSGNVNEKRICAPLFLTPAALEYDSQEFYLTVSKTSTVLNKAVFDYLNETIGFALPFDITSYKYLDEYETVTQKLHEEALKFENLDFLDTVFLVKAPYEDYLASTVATVSYFDSSENITRLINKGEFDRVETEKVNADDIQPSFFDIPILLDSTQTDAYNTALGNTCSVISGPNGSGKTRVAACIANTAIKSGEKVLYSTCSDSNVKKFKAYAKQCGMSDFIATVSKNNLQKNDFVLSEVNNDVEVFEGLREDIITNHNVISNYYSALHKVREIGFSLYEAISQYERYKTFPYTVNFTNADVSHLSRDDVVRLFDVVSNLAKAGADCHEPYNNPLSYVRCKDFSYELKSSALTYLSDYKAKVCRFISIQNRLVEFLGIEVSVIKQSQTESLIYLSELLSSSIDSIYPAVMNIPNVEADFTSIEYFLETVSDFFETRDYINSSFTSDVLAVDADALLNDWRNASIRFAIARTTAQNAIKNKLKLFAFDPKSITSDNASDLLSRLSEYKNVLTRINEISPIVRRLFDIDLDAEISRGNKEVFSQLKNNIERTREYNSIIFDIYASEKAPQTVYTHNENHFSGGDRFVYDFEQLYASFKLAYSELQESEAKAVEILQLDIELAKNDNCKIWYYFVEKFIDRMLENLDLLKHWCAWNRAKETAIESGLKSLVALYMSEQMTYNDIRNAFLKGFFKTVSEYILSCEPDINNFSKDSFEAIESRLILDSERWREYSATAFRASVSNRIRQKIENDYSMSADNALMLARREFSFNDKFYNVEEKNKKMLTDIKPCIISKRMSYFSQLATSDSFFDLLIVDTANDYKREELLLLIPLAKRVVFLVEENAECEIASYLVKQGCAHSSLSWLYGCNYSTRLVNKLFYPSSTSFIYPDNDRRGVRVIKQKANYDRRNTRSNFIEANTVVDEIMRRLEESSAPSLSVVAMTEEQASLIELLFTKRLQSLSESKQKAFFDGNEFFSITSLEKVTFNPCDTVIISTTFSVEEKPKYNDTISRTMPELSSKGAIQKLVNSLLCAQNELVLVTSLDKELLDKFKTVIPDYLMFKEIVLLLCGDEPSPDIEMNKSTRIENSIMRQVINHIESLGYKADIDVGTNSCRIDVAVKKQNGDGYLFGIIFDESAYMYGGDLISRALIRRNLESLVGWNILRIYTVEWFENSPKQLDLITEMLKDGNPSKDSIISFDAF